MSSPIGVLWAKLAVDHAGFVSDLNKARSEAQKQGASIANAFDQLGTSVNKSIKRTASSIFNLKNAFSGISVITGISVGGFGYMVKAALDSADALEKTAGAAGLSTTELQELGFAASQSGINTETMNGALKTFAKNLGQARAGTGSLKESLEKISPSLLQAVVSAGSTDQALRLIFSALGKMTAASDRAALSASAFGKAAGVDMVNLLSNGVEGLDAMRAKAHELGLVLDEVMIHRAAEAQDKLEILSMVVKTNITAAIGEAIPLISAMADALTALVRASVQSANALSSMFKGLTNVTAAYSAAMKVGTFGINLGTRVAGVPAAQDSIPPAAAKKTPQQPYQPIQPNSSRKSAPAEPAAPDESKFPIQPLSFDETSKFQKERLQQARELMQEQISDTDRLAQAKSRILELEPQLITLTGSQAAAQEVMASAIGKVESKYSFMGQFAVQAHGAISDSLSTAILESKSLSETLENVHQALIRIVVQMVMMKTVGSAFSMMGFAMPVGMTWAGAKGGVFDGGRPTAFGSGTIVRRPTLFPMATGMGLMGEAGPEGILPLTRIGGDLGVKADLSGGGSGGVTLIQHMPINGVDFSDPAVIRKIARGLANDARYGGLETLRLGGVLFDQAEINSRRAR